MRWSNAVHLSMQRMWVFCFGGFLVYPFRQSVGFLFSEFLVYLSMHFFCLDDILFYISRQSMFFFVLVVFFCCYLGRVCFFSVVFSFIYQYRVCFFSAVSWFIHLGRVCILVSAVFWFTHIGRIRCFWFQHFSGLFILAEMWFFWFRRFPGSILTECGF